MSPASVSVPIISHRMSHTGAGRTVPAVRLWIELLFTCRAGDPIPVQCLLDSGAPICVVPFAIWQANDVAWQALPGPWPAGFTTWQGVPCTVGCVDVWIPQPDAPFAHGPLTLIGKFTQATPASIRSAFPVLLGLNFLADHHADTEFQCHTVPHAGTIVVP
jgi:hypothetical protein